MVVIGADIKGFKDAMDSVKSSTKDATNGISDAFGGVGKASKKTGGIIKSAFSTGIGGITKTLGKLGGAVKNTVGAIGKIAGAVGVFKLVNGAINMVTASFDSAISRVDTLNQFPKVLSLMGYEAEDAERATKKLAEGIQGLPTRLDEVTGTTQRMVNIFQDVDKATDSTLALNNAFLASGSSQDQANRGLEQYIQMLSTGKVDMQSWRTLQETMPYALQQTAEAFGFTGRSAQSDFYDALQGGHITMDQFNNKIVELSEAQGGFAEVALESTKGIRTSWTNIKTAITNGVAGAITAFNDWLKSAGFGEIHDVLDGIKDRVGEVFKSVATHIPKVMDFFLNLFRTISGSQAFNSLKDAIGAVIDTGRQLITDFFQSQSWDTIKNKIRDIATAILEMDFKETIKQIGEFLNRWSPLIAGITAGIVAFKAIFVAIKTVAAIKATLLAISVALNVGMLPLIATVGAIAIAIGVLIAVGVYLCKNWDEVSSFLTKSWEFLKKKSTEIFSAIGNFLTKTWDSIKDKAQTIWNSIKTYFTNVWSSIKDKASSIWNSIKDYFTNVWGSIKDRATSIFNSVKEFFSNIWESIKAKTNSVWESIKGSLTSLWDSLKSGVERVFGAIKSIINTIWNSVRTITDTVWGLILKGIELYLNLIKTVVTTIFNAVKAVIETIWIGIKLLLETLWKGIATVATTVFGLIETIITTVWNSVKRVTSTIWEAIKNAISLVINSIKSIITLTFGLIQTAITTVWTAIQSSSTIVWNAIRTTISTIVNSIKSVITTVFESVKVAVNAVWNSIKTVITTAINGAKTAVTNAVNGIKSTASSAFNSVKSTATSVWNGIKSAIKKPIEQARDSVRDAIEKMKGFMNFKWSLPKLKMPKFSISGEFGLNPPSVPKMGLEWFKTGGIATGPSVVGIGEAGAEAVVPLSGHRMKPFADAVASMMPNQSNESGNKETIITGNTFVVREEADIKKVAQELFKLENRERRARGKR